MFSTMLLKVGSKQSEEIRQKQLGLRVKRKYLVL